MSNLKDKYVRVTDLISEMFSLVFFLTMFASVFTLILGLPSIVPLILISVSGASFLVVIVNTLISCAILK